MKEKLQVSESKLVETTTILSQALTRISELEALVLKLSTKKNSKNSSNPPSSDIARKNQSLRPTSNKPVGGQKGHRGHTLEMSDTPDVKEELRPDFCSECGVSLLGLTFDLVSRRQVIDIPPIIPIITEYQSYGTQCACGHHACGTYPEGVNNHVQYGKNIQVLAIYLSYFQFLPFARLQDFFKKVCHLSIGKGTIENILRRAAQKAIPAYKQIQKVVLTSFFVGSDETSFKIKGGKNWFWVWQTALVTYIVAAKTRGKQVITDCFPDGLPNSILGSDRWAAQLSTITKGNQICLAHLLRELNYLIELEKQDWAISFKKLLQDAIKLKQDKAFYPKNDPLVVKIEERADQLLAVDWLEIQFKDKVAYQNTITFFNGMNKQRQALFPFLYSHLVPYDNNSSERAFRMVKVKTKISGQFKSLQHDFAIIRSVIDTAIKNGQSAFEAIYAIVDMPTEKNAAG